MLEYSFLPALVQIESFVPTVHSVFSDFPGDQFLELPTSFYAELIFVNSDVPPTIAPSVHCIPLFPPQIDLSHGSITSSLFPLLSISLRILEEAVLVAKDTVVCGFHKKNMEWCLCVWRGWGCHELEIFYQSYEELGHMETSMRKRR